MRLHIPNLHEPLDPVDLLSRVVGWTLLLAMLVLLGAGIMIDRHQSRCYSYLNGEPEIYLTNKPGCGD
jgi:hypothetical protein